jgi:hypothetical protein
MNFLRVIFLVREVIFRVPNNSKYLIFQAFAISLGEKLKKDGVLVLSHTGEE